jgi:hypothetical protein
MALSLRYEDILIWIYQRKMQALYIFSIRLAMICRTSWRAGGKMNPPPLWFIGIKDLNRPLDVMRYIPPCLWSSDLPSQENGPEQRSASYISIKARKWVLFNTFPRPRQRNLNLYVGSLLRIFWSLLAPAMSMVPWKRIFHSHDSIACQNFCIY